VSIFVLLNNEVGENGESFIIFLYSYHLLKLSPPDFLSSPFNKKIIITQGVQEGRRCEFWNTTNIPKISPSLISSPSVLKFMY